jgi:DNA repair protein RadC
VNGSGNLSDPELLSLIIGGRMAEEKALKVMRLVKYRFNELAKMSRDELVNNSLTDAESARVIALFEINRRKLQHSAEDVVKIKMSRDVFSLMYPTMVDKQVEEFWVVFLSRNNSVIGKERISLGGTAGTVTDLKVILKKAVEKLASGIICVHNHPSGNIYPSDADKKITKRIAEAASLLDVTLLDHVIIAGDKYFSFGDDGLI